MAIAPTGNIFKALSFDNVSSRTYGVYITGEAVYNAPEREVEMISIPGRNGAFALDKGRFQNIEVTYPAGIFADNEADFAQGISDFRNFLCSRNGYVRLTDDYNPDEYRMAVYKSGLDVSPAQLKAGEFQIVFDCKPQRFLTSGEEPITIGEWHETETASGEIASFEAKAGDAVKSLVVDIEPLQSGSGTPSPTNVRPISGYDSVVVSRCGKNFLDVSNLVRTGWNIGGIPNKLKPNTTYTYSVNGTTSYLYALFLATSGTDANSATTRMTAYINAGRPSVTFTTPSTMTEGWLVLAGGSSSAVNEDIDNILPQIELGTTATDYEAHDGQTHTTALGRTVYGGTLDVASGVLTVTHKLVTLNGTETWFMNQAGYFALQKSSYDATLSTTEAYSDTMICNMLPYVYTQPSSQASFNAITHTIRVSMPNISTLADFKTWLGSNNLQFILQLATPTTVQLTAQEVELLVGLNQIWANSGDVSVEYGTAPNVLINPTLFESSPMLEVEGYGTIAFNGYEITINDVVIGEIETSIKSSQNIGKIANNALPKTFSKTVNYSAHAGALESGDSLFVNAIKVTSVAKYLGVGATPSPTITSDIGTASASGSVRNYSQVESGGTYNYADFTTTASISGIELTAFTNETHSATVTSVLKYSNNNTAGTITYNISITNTSSGVLTIQVTCNGTNSGLGDLYVSGTIEYGRSYLYSTRSILGSPLYVDCDLGEAYKYEGGTIVSVNQHVDLGSDLPKLGAGANEITYDGTVTDLKITPKWWKV